MCTSPFSSQTGSAGAKSPRRLATRAPPEMAGGKDRVSRVSFPWPLILHFHTMATLHTSSKLYHSHATFAIGRWYSVCVKSYCVLLHATFIIAYASHRGRLARRRGALLWRWPAPALFGSHDRTRDINRRYGDALNKTCPGRKKLTRAGGSVNL